jgi:hypothetical protein
MFTSAKISYEIGGNVEATPFGGIFAMHRLVTRLGLVKKIDADLTLLKIHLPYHESDHVLNLAYNVLTGGTRGEDIDRLRNDVPSMNGLGTRLIPDPTTAGDFLRRFTEADLLVLMDTINSVRPPLWRGRDLLGEVASIDVDGTIVPTTGQLKQGMDISHQGIWGYAPLLVTPANTRRSALPGQPIGQRPQPSRRGGLDRPGHRSSRPARAAGVPARGHRLLPDRPLRPVGPARRLHPRHGLQRHPARPRRRP